MKFYQVGQKLFRSGDAERGIPACMACHGPSGAGNPGPPYPHVGGQQADYVVRRLQEYRAGTTSESDRSEEHTSELQSLLRTSSAVFCLNKKNNHADLSQVTKNTPQL